MGEGFDAGILTCGYDFIWNDLVFSRWRLVQLPEHAAPSAGEHKLKTCLENRTCAGSVPEVTRHGFTNFQIWIIVMFLDKILQDTCQQRENTRCYVTRLEV